MHHAKRTILALVVASGIAFAANTVVDLSSTKDVPGIQKISATISVPGKPVVSFEMGKYIIALGRLEWMLERSYDGTFDAQKKIDLEFFESKKVIEQKPNLVIYQSGFMGSKSVRFLMFKNVSGGVFCRTRAVDSTLAEVQTMVKACDTLAAKK
jgi:hypothetical protein